MTADKLNAHPGNNTGDSANRNRGASDDLLSVHLDRLLITLEAENLILNDPTAEYTDNTSRDKQQLSTQLSMADISAGISETSPAVLKKIEQVKAALAENERNLKNRLAALENITEVISSAIREVNSDGTYGSRSGFGNWNSA